MSLRAGVVVLLVSWGAGAGAQQAPEPLEVELAPAKLKARIAAVDTLTGLDAPTRAELKSNLEQALALVNRATAREAQAAAFQSEAAAAPNLLAAIKRELATPSEAPAVAPEGSSLGQLERLVAKAEQELEVARKRVGELRKEQTERGERRAALPPLMSASRKALATAEAALAAPREDSPLGQAKRLKLLAERRLARAELQALNAEVSSYDARRELLPARIDQAARQQALAERQLEAAQAQVTQRRRVEVERATRAAERLRLEVARRSEPVQALARQNEALARLRSGSDGLPGTAARLEQATRELTATRELLATVRERFASVRAKVAAAGVTHPMGLLLRKELEGLPDQAALERQIEQRAARISDVQYQLIARSEERSRAGDVERQARDLLAGLKAGAPEQGRGDLERVLRELLTSRRDLLGALAEDYERLFTQLVDLDNTTRQLVRLVREYRQFIEERILWVRSVSGSAVPSRSDLTDALRWLVDGESWARGGKSTLEEAGRRWVVVLFGGAVILFVLLGRVWARGRIRRMAGVVERDPGDRFGYTALAAAIVLIRATGFPALVWGLGWLLAAPAGQSAVLTAAAAGLSQAAIALFAYELLRHVLQQDGLGEVHFRWPGEVCGHVRKHLRWFIPLKLLTVFLVATFDHQRQSDLWNDGLGRGAFVVGMVALAAFNACALNLRGPLRQVLARQPEGWLHRLRYVWYGLAIGLPALLGLLALRGYYYTAVRLESRMQAWLWLFLTLLLCDALFLRWLRVARRRLHAAERQEPAAGEEPPRQEAETQAPPSGDEEELGAAPAEPAPPVEPAAGAAAERARALIGVELDTRPEQRLAIPEIDAQTRQLFRSAIVLVVLLATYLIWADVLPALRRLDQVQLYPELRLSAPATEASGTLVTLTDLLLSLVVLAFTVAAARNLPGLLEILLLRRLSFDAGSRYAAITLSRYVIVVVGASLALSRVGITWDKVQWLAAALTFGLAFGLQEIFANFVSGLIILFERLIRVGDVVTVGDTSGVVTRIRMRATIVTDFDRKELIVPNKRFVTGEVLNWVLSDAVVRVVIPVGVGYTAKVEEARRIMTRVAAQHRLVLERPPPSCQLRALGASTFDFELWVFVASLEDMSIVRHDVTREVHAELSAAGIDLPFPQQEVHLRTDGPTPGATPSSP